MSADPFALLHFLRALAAVEDERRSLTESAERRRAYIAAGDHSWDAPPTEAEITQRAGASAQPPAFDARETPPLAEVATWLDARCVRLLHVATGDTRHAEDPAGWMASRGWFAYAHRGEHRTFWRATMAEAWRLPHHDPHASRAFVHCAHDAWVEYLIANEWTRASLADLPRSPAITDPMRAPSGKVYGLWACSRAGEDSTPAIDVALSRGGFDAGAELRRGADAAAALRARIPAKAPRKGRRK